MFIYIFIILEYKYKYVARVFCNSKLKRVKSAIYWQLKIEFTIVTTSILALNKCCHTVAKTVTTAAA